MENEINVPVEESVVSQVAEATCDDDAVDTGHKVVFYIILGLIGLSGVGIPVLVFLLVKEHKKRKQAEDALNEKNGTTPTTEDAKKEETPEDKKETSEEKK